MTEESVSMTARRRRDPRPPADAGKEPPSRAARGTGRRDPAAGTGAAPRGADKAELDLEVGRICTEGVLKEGFTGQEM